MAPNMTPMLIAAPLVALALWRRTRTQFGPQPVRRGRIKARLALFAVVLALASLSGLRDLRLLEGLLAGLVGGGALGLLGLRLTRFERSAEGRDIYLPNPWVGGVVTVLLVARLAWRFMVVMPQAGTGASAVNSPLTMAVLGLMFGYYLCYYAGLLVHHARFERARAVPGT